jgi:hypothetical protein
MQPQPTAPSAFSPSVTAGAAILNVGGSIFLPAAHQSLLAASLSIIAAMLLTAVAASQWYSFAKAYVDFQARRPQPEPIV